VTLQLVRIDLFETSSLNKTRNKYGIQLAQMLIYLFHTWRDPNNLLVLGQIVDLIDPKYTKDKAILDVGAGLGCIVNTLVKDQNRKPSRIVFSETDEHLKTYLESKTEWIQSQGITIDVHKCDHMSLSFLTSLSSPDWLGDAEGKTISNWRSSWDSEAKLTTFATLGPKVSDLNLSHFLRWMSTRSGIHAFGRVPLFLFSPRLTTNVREYFISFLTLC
jgi:hypothetical protein